MMNRKIWAIAKLNLKTIKPAYLISGIVLAALAVSNLINYIIWSDAGFGSDLSPVNALWLLTALAAILIPARNFRRIINLGGRRNNFIWGSLVVYVILAAAVSFVVTLMNFTIEPLLERSAYYDPNFLGGIANLSEVFGWATRGFVVAFLQQFAFLFFFSAFLHALTSIQNKWYGWVADIAIIAIISVFTPIAPLRTALVGFFYLILLAGPLVQIPACIILGFGIYALNKPILARQAI